MMEKYHKTAQRTTILEYVKNNKHHPNIIDIYKNVSKKLSTISMTTVYNTMELLKKDGLVHELSVRNIEGRRFDSNLNPHDHLICRICGTVFDIEINVDQSLLLTEKQQQGFEVTEICINVYGVCTNCQNMDSKANN